jgi:predicted nucleotidyltransferase
VRYRIQRLEVFGSAARTEDFEPLSSDADFLVEFAQDAPPALDAFFGAKAELEALLGRNVDLVEPGAVRNPFILASINRHREAIYVA